MDIDLEWQKFLSSTDKNYEVSSDEENDEFDDENVDNISLNGSDIISANITDDLSDDIPNSTDIYISTKTNIAYLNTPIDLNIFWDIPIIPYFRPENGVIKKQIKLISNAKEDLEYIEEKLKNETCYDVQIISHIDNIKTIKLNEENEENEQNEQTFINKYSRKKQNDKRKLIRFKDTRKISIGICKKDLTSYRRVKKGVFYNCFVMILRLNSDNEKLFKEYHVKVFNTGKVEIPGVKDEKIFELILEKVTTILQPFVNIKLNYKKNSNEIVLINSNFNCGYYVNRESLYEILKLKYNIHAVYDPCSYPGIQCTFYYNPDVEIQTGRQISDENKQKYKNIQEVSFMIFRTGSVLIVGKCNEHVLTIIYDFLKNIFKNEFKKICQKKINIENEIKEKPRKIRKKCVTIEVNSQM